MALAKLGNAAIGVGMSIPTQIAAEKVFELVVEPVIYCKKWAKKLEETALLLKPSIDEYVEIASNPNLSDLSAPRYQRFKEFQGVLQSAIDRARKAQQTNTLSVQEKFNDAKEIHEFLEKIDDFIRFEGPPNLALDSRQLRVDVGNLGRKLAQTSAQLRPILMGYMELKPLNGPTASIPKSRLSQRKHWGCMSVSMRSNKFSTRGM